MNGSPAGPELLPGRLAPEVAAELPGLALTHTAVALGPGRSAREAAPVHARERLRELSSRIRGGHAIALRSEPIAAAHRAFFRQIGLDPDVQPTPLEAVVQERLMQGGFASLDALSDALLIALLDTGVAVWALDATRHDGRLGVRLSREGETLGEGAGARLLPAGGLVVADSRAPLGELFGDPVGPYAPGRATTELTLFALRVPGVPSLFVEEALWSARLSLVPPAG